MNSLNISTSYVWLEYCRAFLLCKLKKCLVLQSNSQSSHSTFLVGSEGAHKIISSLKVLESLSKYRYLTLSSRTSNVFPAYQLVLYPENTSQNKS